MKPRMGAVMAGVVWALISYVIVAAWLSPHWPDVVRVMVTGLAAAALGWFEAQRHWEIAYRLVKRQLDERDQAEAHPEGPERPRLTIVPEQQTYWLN